MRQKIRYCIYAALTYLQCSPNSQSYACGADYSVNKVRSVTAIDLLTLRNIGGAGSGVSISPDGHHVVFEVHQADPVENTYRSEWDIFDTRTSRLRTIVPDGGDPILTYGDGVGYFSEIHDGYAVLSPVWTPDGEAFYYIRRDRRGGAISLHRVDIRSGSDLVVKTPIGDVVDLKKREAGTVTITVASPTVQTIAQAQNERERGMLFPRSSQFTPFSGLPDFLPSKVRTDYEMNLRTGDIQKVEGTQASVQPLKNGQVLSVAESPDHSKLAWLQIQVKQLEDGNGRQPADVGGVYFSVQGRAAVQIGEEKEFALYTTQLGADAWSQDSRHIYYVRSTDTINSAMFVADTRSGGTRQLTGAHEYLSACSFAETVPLAACRAETATEPANIALIDLKRGGVRVVTDLNRDYNKLEKARTESVYWSNRFGDFFWGTLTYPLGFQSEKRYPLIISGQHGGGFSRGSNGNEFPIPVLSANGFFVLDVPTRHWSIADTHPTVDEAFRALVASDNAYVDGLEQGVSMLASRGVDGARVGICGVSAGSEMANMVISRSTNFSAAIIDSAWPSPSGYYLMGESNHEMLRNEGFGTSPYDTLDRWKQTSPALRVDRITTPLLINAADREYLASLEQYWQMRDHQRPVELWVFNDEHHAKWQPKHRLVIYSRNVDWFNYWLRDVRDGDPSKSEQYERWNKLRIERDTLINHQAAVR